MKKILNKVLKNLPWINSNFPTDKTLVHTHLAVDLQKIEPIAANGSCGLVAYCIYRRLESFGIPCKIVSFSFSFSKWRYPNVHVMVEVGDYYVDAKGYTPKEFTYQRVLRKNYLTPEQLEEALYDRKRWNKDFNWNLALEIWTELVPYGVREKLSKVWIKMYWTGA